jgi:kynureninase
VFEFHQRHGLTAERLREINRHQVGFLSDAFERLDADPNIAAVVPMPDERRAGFLAIRSPRAGEIVRELRERDVLTDCRGSVLRLGPAPYVGERQLRDAIDALAQAIR